MNRRNSSQSCMFFKFWRKKPGQKPKLERDRDSKLKLCHRPGLGVKKVEKHWSNTIIFFSDGQGKSGQGFDSPQPQSKESESPPEEVIRDDQRDLMSEGGFPEATYNLGEATRYPISLTRSSRQMMSQIFEINRSFFTLLSHLKE